MAAEQRGCRETRVVHPEWLSVREQPERERAAKGTDRRRTSDAGQKKGEHTGKLS